MKCLFVSEKKTVIWFIGNITEDIKIFGDKRGKYSITATGGAVTFSSMACITFFTNIECKIYSVGIPDRLELFEKITLVNLGTKSDNLSKFILDYTGETRRIKLDYFPDKKIHIPDNDKNYDPDIIFIQPVYQEILETTVIELHKKYPRALICCDPQGWLRERQKDASIHHKIWNPSQELLESLNILKFSLEDLSAYSKQRLKDFLLKLINSGIHIIITLGNKGAFHFTTKNSLFCPSIIINDVKDTTGAGDFFISFFGIIFHIFSNKENLKYTLGASTVLTSIMLQFKEQHFKLNKKNIFNQINSYISQVETYSVEIGLNKL